MRSEVGEYIELAVIVRTDLVGEFYEMLGRLHGHKPKAVTKSEIRRGWEYLTSDHIPERMQDAEAIYFNTTTTCRDIINMLLDIDQNAQLSGKTLAAALNMEIPEFTGSLSSLAIWSNKVNRVNPLRSQPFGAEEGQYWLDMWSREFLARARERWEDR